MNELNETVSRWAAELKTDICGVADAVIANAKAPPGFRPEDQLPGARSVIIFGKSLPAGIFHTPQGKEYYNLYYKQSEWKVYEEMDNTALQLAHQLEAETGYSSIPLPADNPYVIDNGQPKGRVSLKHMGQLAGLGSIGVNSLLINPDYGNLIRLGGVITRAPLSSGNPTTEDVCPKGCSACIDICPANAVRDRSVDIIACLSKSVTHPLMKPFALTKFLFYLSKYSKTIRNLTGDITNQIVSDHYTYSCNECMKACPFFKKALKKAEKR